MRMFCQLEGFKASKLSSCLPIHGRKQRQDLAGPCVSVQLGLLEHRRAVPHDFEPTLPRCDELHLRGRILSTNLGRQTDGPWFVVSKRAVLDGDSHLALKLEKL
jgi:hypothetical protein